MIRNSKHIYTSTPVKDGFLDHYVHKVIPARESDTTITLEEKYENAPDLLALELYGDPNLWWVVPQRNGLQDPIFDLKTDTTLVIPSYDTVKSLF